MSAYMGEMRLNVGKTIWRWVEMSEEDGRTPRCLKVRIEPADEARIGCRDRGWCGGVQ